MTNATKKQVKTASAPILVELVRLVTINDQPAKITSITVPGFTNVMTICGMLGNHDRNHPWLGQITGGYMMVAVGFVLAGATKCLLWGRIQCRS